MSHLPPDEQKIFTLLSIAAVNKYGTKQLKVSPRIKNGISIKNDGIILMENSDVLIIEDGLNMNEDEVRDFADKYFLNNSVVFARLNSIINPKNSYKTIF